MQFVCVCVYICVLLIFLSLCVMPVTSCWRRWKYFISDFIAQLVLPLFRQFYHHIRFRFRHIKKYKNDDYSCSSKKHLKLRWNSDNFFFTISFYMYNGLNFFTWELRYINNCIRFQSIICSILVNVDWIIFWISKKKKKSENVQLFTLNIVFQCNFLSIFSKGPDGLVYSLIFSVFLSWRISLSFVRLINLIWSKSPAPAPAPTAAMTERKWGKPKLINTQQQ